MLRTRRQAYQAPSSDAPAAKYQPPPGPNLFGRGRATLAARANEFAPTAAACRPEFIRARSLRLSETIPIAARRLRAPSPRNVARSLNTSLVVLLALVPYGEDVDLARSVDFKQRYVSRGTKRNDKFSQKRIVRKRFTAGERRETQ